MLLFLVYFVKIINQREVMEHFAESAPCKGTIFIMLKQEGCTLQIKVARGQDNVFLFELCINKV